MARAELFIWWTTDAECRQIGPECSGTLPAYVREQYALRAGQAGRGRLWCDRLFGEREITDWPKTMIAHMIQDSGSGGIVFQGKDLPLFKDSVGGLVTDFKLRIMVVK